MQAQNKPINDICNIKLGKKYLFKTVQSPSTQSEHINRYSFGFSSFGLWLLSLGVPIFSSFGLLCFGCPFWSGLFLLHRRRFLFRLLCQALGTPSFHRLRGFLRFNHVAERKLTRQLTKKRAFFFRGGIATDQSLSKMANV